MKKIQGFKKTMVQNLKKNDFFFFPNGRKRAMCEGVKVGINYTEITATSPSGITFKREVLNDKLITVYE